MELKHKLAFEVCQQQGLGEKSLLSVYQMMWHNFQQNGGKRLTQQGFEWLQDLGLPFYTINLTNQQNQTGSILLGLDRFLKAPYYLKGKKLSVFDENFSTQLMIYNGDLEAYIRANCD